MKKVELINLCKERYQTIATLKDELMGACEQLDGLTLERNAIQARVKELEGELVDLKEVMKACKHAEGYCYDSTAVVSKQTEENK